MFRSKRNAPSHDGPRRFTVPRMKADAAEKVTTILQSRLVSLIDTALTLKHIHWNVVGPNFIGVHKMLDPQVDGVLEMVDETAERIATLGASPIGLPGYIVGERGWDDYAIGRDTVQAHLGALDVVYTGVISSHRDAIDELGELDLVSQEMVIEQTRNLELYHWFVRAHLEDPSGALSTEGATTETAAAETARAAGA